MAYDDYHSRQSSYRNSNYSYHDPYNPSDYEMGTVHSGRSSRFTARSANTGVNVPLLAPDVEAAAAVGYAGIHAEEHHHEKRRKDKHFYDRGSRTLAFVGIIWSLQGAVAFAVMAAIVWIKAAPSQECTKHCSAGNERYPDNSLGILILWDVGVPDWILKLAFNAVVTMCNLLTGNVHATTLRWALIKEGHPGFNANLRFFTAVGGWFSLNGYITNFLHIACLIVSQASVSVIFLPGPNSGQTLMPSMAIMAIAASLLIQCVLVLLAYWKTHVPTWSSSPLDVVAAAKDDGLLKRVNYRCMRAAADVNERTVAPINARKRQPNAWNTHKQVRYIVSFSWVMVFVAFLWSYVLFAVISADLSSYIVNGCRIGGFVPTGDSLQKCYVSFTFNSFASVEGSLPNNKSIAFNLVLFIIFQGILAVGLHLCELIVTLSRDEDVWRKASAGGAEHTGNQFYNFFSWKVILYLTFNPLLHWIMGNSLVINQGTTAMYPMQIVWLTIGLAIIAILITGLALYEPRGEQPSAFGHLQTLADLMDEDAKTFFWGHKSRDEATLISHAGTSAKPLPRIRSDQVYAGTWVADSCANDSHLDGEQKKTKGFSVTRISYRSKERYPLMIHCLRTRFLAGHIGV